MYTSADLRKGLKIEIDRVPFLITDFNFQKPGKGTSIYTCKLKNLLSGSSHTRTFRPNDRFDVPNVEDKKLVFSYKDISGYIFMDDSYEQVTLSEDVLGDNRFYLSEDIEVHVSFYNGNPIDVTLPAYVEKEIIHTEPGARGNTATNVLKSALIEGDFEIKVPLFVNIGDVVKIDTRTGEYSDRVAKKVF